MKLMPWDNIPEYILRVWKLMEPPRSMSYRAAKTVVDAAMGYEECIEGKVRAEIEKRKESENDFSSSGQEREAGLADTE
jgi:hypothetical protein